jgi:multiple sugar transport system ATP-binding protein
MAEVSLRNLEKKFPDGTVALQALDLQIHDGELLVVLGPSGSGKSTLLELLAGLEQPSAGEIAFDGYSVMGMEPRERNIAMVFQNYALYPHMTVRENLEFPLKMANRPREERRKQVEDTARRLGLQALLEKKPRHLSGGQAQRVAMGRAIVREPSLFLMDEPLSNLDAKLRVEIRSVITQLQRELKTTTVYVTHDQVEALTIGQRVALLRGGKLQQLDSPQVLYDRPANLFAAGFLGNPAMNLFRADFKGETQLTYLCVGANTLPLSANASLNALSRRPTYTGLRPESFAWTQEKPEWPRIEARVSAVEVLGHEQLAYLDVELASLDSESVDRGETPRCLPEGEGELIARLSSRFAIEAESSISLALDPEGFHWFDAQGDAMH